jgi:galactonate dehydratase
MKIARVQALPVRLPHAREAALGTAGSPTALAGSGSGYHRSPAVGALYSTRFETALVKVTLDNGLAGWGEAQAPLAPQVVCSIVGLLLRPVLEDAPFDGAPERIATLWDAMYSTMRVRGQTGGFMLDAISGVDLALWDLAGQIAGRPVAALLSAFPPRAAVPAYLSGVSGSSTQARVEWARPFAAAGFRTAKIFFDDTPEALFDTVRALQGDLGLEVAVDALWRLTPDSAPAFCASLDRLGARWLEAPLPPEDPLAHGALARSIRTPLALGESYRTCHELAPFFRERAVAVVQPDLGRCGLTEGLRIAELARRHGVPVVPHVSIAMGPQIAAAIHFAAALPDCPMLEFNPTVFEVANRFLAGPLRLEETAYRLPSAPGLGAVVIEDALRAENLESEILYYYDS